MSFIIIFGTLSFPMTAKGRIAAAIYRIRLSYRPHGGQYLYFDRNGRGMPPPKISIPWGDPSYLIGLRGFFASAESTPKSTND